MSNVFFTWPLLYILFGQSVLAGPRSMVSLSPQVASVVPPCAQQCLESFIAKNFPRNVCHNQQHLDCLCSRKSVSGLTLGEGALQCVASHCSEEVLRNASLGTYELCLEISSARPMTHGTLTATQAATTTVTPNPNTRTMTTPDSIGLQSSIPSSITDSFSGISNTVPTSLVTASSWSRESSPSEPLSSTLLIPTDQVSSSSKSPTAAKPSSSAATAQKPTLTNSQIAGITVAGVASAALAFGLLFCIFCIRRRKSRNRLSTSSSFGGDKVVETRPGSPDLPPAFIQSIEHGHQMSSLAASEERQSRNIPSASDQSRWSISRRNTRPEDIGVAVAQGSSQEPAYDDIPISATSYRTTSQLLPDKPVYSLFPPRLRAVNPRTSPVSPQSPDSFNAPSSNLADTRRPFKPASRGRNTLDTSQKTLQEDNRTVHLSVSDPFLDSHKDAEGPIYAGENSGAGSTSWTRSLEALRKPVPARQYQKDQLLQPTKTRVQPAMQLRDPSVYIGRPMFGVASKQTQPAEQAIRSQTKRKGSIDRPSTFYSSASETSFEDAGDEDEMPTRHPALSPVAEHPRPPPSLFTHPKIPGRITTSKYSRQPPPESPTPRPPPKNPLRAIVAQQTDRSRGFHRPEAAELPGSPVTSPVSPLAGRNDNGQGPDSPRSAKWKILVGPGLEGIENTGPTHSTRENESQQFSQS